MPRFLNRLALAAALLALPSAACSAAFSSEPAEDPTGATAATSPSTTVEPSTTTTTTTSTTTTSTTTTTTTTTLPPITVAFAGDTSFTHGLSDRDPLGEITELLSSPDLMAVNLETTVAEPDVGTAANKKYTFKSPPASVGLLTKAGIDFVQLANNHTLDFGRPALLRTLELLDDGELPHAGAGTGPAEAYAPRFVDVEGWTVGIVAFSRVPCDWSASGENTRPEVAWTCDPFVIDTMAAVEDAAEQADLVVVMVHWGIERDHCPQPYQRSLATAWAELGADLIIGGHPHVLQGVERIGESWLVNSTGNFAFPSARNASARTAVFSFDVTTEGIGLTVHPVTIASGRPAPASGAAGASILDDLERWSFGIGFDEDGTAHDTDAVGACG